MQKEQAGELKAYWAPGCSSCLRMKEFLAKHNVKFKSINVRDDLEGLAELEKLGIRQIPIAMRGDDWVDGQILSEVARLAGVPFGKPQILPPAVLAERISTFTSAALSLIEYLPEEKFQSKLPNSPRSYAELVCHVFQIVQAYVEVMERGRRLVIEDIIEAVPPHTETRAQLTDYCASLKNRFDVWWARAGAKTDYSADADVYYGKQTVHEFFERTTWHSGQHTRQLEAVVEALGFTPKRRMPQETFSGLPMPVNVYDDKLVIAN